ncbi:MAG: hypothetical protein WCJ01_03590 [Ignavibacteria bacterium]
MSEIYIFFLCGYIRHINLVRVHPLFCRVIDSRQSAVALRSGFVSLRSGIVLVHNSGRIEVLEYKTHLTEKLPVILTNRENQKR